MKKDFVTYEIALALKELGFDKISRFGSEASLYNSKGEHIFYSNYGFMYSGLSDGYISAPLWQQVIDWLREKHSVHIEITCANFFDSYMNNYSYEAKCKVYKNKELDVTFIVRDEKNNHIFYSYENARKQAILKAIEIIKNKQS